MVGASRVVAVVALAALVLPGVCTSADTAADQRATGRSTRAASDLSGPSATSSAAPMLSSRHHRSRGHRGFAFMAPRARWNPCRAIRYRVNTRGAPRRGLRDVRRAFRKARRVSGIRFRYAGHTHRIPMRKHANPYAFGAWRKRDDIVVAWPRRAQTAYFGRGDRAIGYGGSYSTGRARHHGYLLLRRHSHLKAGFGKGRRHGWLGTQGQLYLHEIGHVIGLDHVNRRSQIMYPTMTRKRAKYRAGDRRGLRRLGRRQGCIRGW